jgi:hypothetical protein
LWFTKAAWINNIHSACPALLTKYVIGELANFIGVIVFRPSSHQEVFDTTRSCWSYCHYIVSFWLRQYRFVNRHCTAPMCAGEFYVPAALCRDINNISGRRGTPFGLAAENAEAWKDLRLPLILRRKKPNWYNVPALWRRDRIPSTSAGGNE